ncbi:MAG: hypothetical protein K2J11_09725 [Oscillospiraceae bacterium]|nr:hypothetical protein [Oscillospiraceae bacterium]
MTLETVMNEIHKWYENITKKYAEIIRFEIDKDGKDIFIVNFDTNKYIAQLVVEDIGFHPHRFVSFIALDKERDIHQNYPYLFYDDEKDSVSDIIEKLNSGIEFISN